MPLDDPLLTPESAGRYLGGDEKPIPLTTLAWWRHVGKGPRYLKSGRAVRYRRSWLDTYLAAGERDPEAAR